MYKKLTELSKINALIERLNTWIATQAPEYSEYQRDDNKECKYQKPSYLQDINDSHKLKK